MNIEMIPNSENGNNTLVSKETVKLNELSGISESLRKKYSIYEWRIKKTDRGYKIYIKVEEKNDSSN